MKETLKVEELNHKKLRNLRMNLNNRIETFTYSDKPKELKASHKLHGLTAKECQDLLIEVKRAERKILGKV